LIGLKALGESNKITTVDNIYRLRILITNLSVYIYKLSVIKVNFINFKTLTAPPHTKWGS